VGAHHPAAAQLLRLALEVALLVAEADEDLLGLRLDLGIDEGGVFVRGFLILGALDVAGGLHLGEAFFEGGDFAGAAGGDVHHGLFAEGFAFLGKVADHGPLVALDGAGVGFVLLEDEAEERGFAGAVRADEGDAFAVVDLHGGVLEQRAAAEGFLEFANREH